MGDSLSRCSVEMVKNILSYLEADERRDYATVSLDWQEAVWDTLSFSGAGEEGTSRRTLSRLLHDVGTQCFAHFCTTLSIQDVHKSAWLGDTDSSDPSPLDLLVKGLSRSQILTHVSVLHCSLSVAEYMRVAKGLQPSTQCLQTLALGPIFFLTQECGRQLVELLFSLCGMTLSDPLQVTLCGTPSGIASLLTPDVLPPPTSLKLHLAGPRAE
eukprot:TRINITY_DN14148_c0_g4_i3.p3 TRINITY_DN14148_c0_g4~~TRINITY_DN14148_c0_g4_i3.p3  ORF type:complete len:213 (+),score=59.53 TRINITY_DN14148_c0_g4_i3:828-1466(+)